MANPIDTRIQRLIELGLIREEKDLSSQAAKVIRDLADAEFDVMLLARERLSPAEREAYDSAMVTVAF